MDSKKFFGKIREIIREEIDYALDKKMNSNPTKQVFNNINKSSNIISQPKKIKTESLNKPNSNYASIQELLDETRKTISENYEAFDELRFTSDDVHSYNTVVPNGVNPSDIPDEIANALNRNYSELLKKIDEKNRR